jgi:hypothetical protein
MAVVHLSSRKQPNGNNQNWNVVAKSLTRIHQSPLNIIHFSFFNLIKVLQMTRGKWEK